MFSAAIGAGEQSVLSVQRNRSDRSFDDVAIDFDTTVVEEAREAFPARECIADRLGELGFLADQTELGAQPRLKIVDDWPTFLQPPGAPFIGAAAPDLGLDGIEIGDAFKRLAGDRRRPGGSEFVEAAVSPPPSQLRTFVENETIRWGKIVKDAGLAHSE
jgi:hypothetical protein